jgi:PIN domain nuclease of toxin-antitoxin system
VKVLLDTHTFLWFIEDHPNLSINARTLIEDASNEILLSIASAWEMAIKISLGKLQIGNPFGIFLAQQLKANNIQLLPISLSHTERIITLPFHRRDPFDRLLIAQALIENIPIASADSAFDAYPITKLW